MSSSQPEAGLGDNTICGADQRMPSGLTDTAIDFFGRQESHMRNLPRSCRTQISKQVPYCPPSTGLPGNFSQPVSIPGDVEPCETEDSRPAIAIRIRNSLLFISSFSAC